MAVNERLFREELDYLRRYGKLIARENPRLEKFLASQSTDPGGGELGLICKHRPRPSNR
ncbi:type VI secretion protein, family [Salmonella enterica subsp. salamae]|nr:type VI secretion protein, family [Salmonella enterica subsp. salamae serovar Greenside]VEA59621.1 type VI secretion protein, family [Salmonella enterica subsp. salamae]